MLSWRRALFTAAELLSIQLFAERAAQAQSTINRYLVYREDIFCTDGKHAPNSS